MSWFSLYAGNGNDVVTRGRYNSWDDDIDISLNGSYWNEVDDDYEDEAVRIYLNGGDDVFNNTKDLAQYSDAEYVSGIFNAYSPYKTWNGDVYGGDGNDTILFAADNWGRVWGGDGDDYVRMADIGHHQIWGGAGNDTIFASIGHVMDDDRKNWKTGLSYGGYNTEIYGGTGDGAIYGSRRSEALYGGDGNDFIWAGARTGTAIDKVNMGSGHDFLLLNGNTATVAAKTAFSSFNTGLTAFSNGVGLLKDGLAVLNSLVDKLASSPIGTFVWGWGTSIASHFIKALIAGKPEAVDKSSGDYVIVEDFNLTEDTIAYTSEANDAKFIAEDYNGIENFKLSTDTSLNNAGGVISYMNWDKPLVERLKEHAPYDESVIIRQLGEQATLTALKISKIDGVYKDGNNKTIDLDAVPGLKDYVESLGIKDGGSIAVYGAFGPKILIGSQVTTRGNTDKVFLVGTDYGDAIYGAEPGDDKANANSNAHIYGYGGKDYLEGTDGDDILYGDEHSDIVMGLGGNDKLYTDDDGYWDTMTGGAGADQFIIVNNGRASIKDFEDGSDKIVVDVDGIDNFSQVDVYDNPWGDGAGVIVDTGSGRLHLNNIENTSDITADDFMFV